MNGLISLMRYIPVSKFYVTRQPVGVRNYQVLLRNIPYVPFSIYRGQSFEQAGVTVRVLSPEDARMTNRVANDDSLVLLLLYQGRSILLTGDIERNAEEVLTEIVNTSVDYLKVPHHGSKTSSSASLLEKLRPRIAFISVGSNNWFGHPDPTVLERYRKNHTLVYRTDVHGTIRLKIGSGASSVELVD
jgi:competence protein ComEC